MHFFQRHPRKTLAALFLILFMFGLAPFALYFVIHQQYRSRMYSNLADVPTARAALILGAGIHRDWTPSDILADRIQAGVDLYKQKKVEKLLMSGDNRFANYNEPEVMLRRALELGVPAKDIQADYAGRRTYDSCWRAKNIFGQDKIVVVTQSFHMTRALFICNQLGLDAVGLLADSAEHVYQPNQWIYWQLRDIASLTQSVFHIFVNDPSVVKGEQIPL